MARSLNRHLRGWDGGCKDAFRYAKGVSVSKPQIWTPPLFGLQWAIFNSYVRYLLVSGSRKSGKTIAVLHRIMRHAWETPGARIAVFAKSIKLAKDGGVWLDLINYVIPQWIEGGIGMEITSKNSAGMPGPISDSQTRTLSITLSNMHGGESQIMLFSVDDDAEVGAKVHGKRFSLIFFSELWMFMTHRVFAVTIQQLRMLHLPLEAHMWIADTNPHPDLGNRSWFYQKWYVDRLKKRDLTTQEGRDDEMIYSKMGLIEMFSKDNPHLTAMDLAELRSQTRGDQNLYESYALGIHGEAGQKSNFHFAPYFLPQVHVVGGGEGEGDQIDVDPQTTMLYSGSDLGNVNHSFVILQKRWMKIGEDYKSVWDVLDEIIWLESREDLQTMGLEMTKKIDEIEAKCGRKLRWQHWTDSSAIDQFRAASGTYDYQQILAGSGGRIEMQGVEKPDGNVRFRARLLRQLLQDNRIFISARCVGVIEMIREAKRGQKILNANTDDRIIVNTEKNYVMPEYRHTFDGLTYAIMQETRDELTTLATRPSASRPMGLVQVG